MTNAILAGSGITKKVDVLPKPFKTSFNLNVEGFFRTRRFIHEFSKLVLQLVFRWGDAGT